MKPTRIGQYIRKARAEDAYVPHIHSHGKLPIFHNADATISIMNHQAAKMLSEALKK